MVGKGFYSKMRKPVVIALGFLVVSAGIPAQAGGEIGFIPSLPMKDRPPLSQRAPGEIEKEDGPYLFQQLDVEDTYGEAPLQGSITSLRVTRGRSQIIKFAQPIARISIANPAVADVIPLGPDQLMINGKLRGVTSLIVWDENGQEGIFDLYVENDTSELLRAIETIAPDEKIGIRVTDDSFILSGQVSNSVLLDEIRHTARAYGYGDDKFVNLAEAPVPQVVLEVKIAEAARSTARILKTGFSINAGNSFTMTRLGSSISAPSAFGWAYNDIKDIPIPVFFGGEGDEDARPPGIIPPRPISLSQTGENIGGITSSLLGMNPHDPFAMTFDFLETKGLVTILAEPKLVCTHGRSAAFLAGGEFPFVKGTDQNGSPIIEFKDFGVKLNFTPWIAIRSGRIELKVAPEVSSIDTTLCEEGAGDRLVCGLSKRATETTVELEDGESLMISGILTRQEQNSFQQVPFLGNLPIIGQFFSNSDKGKSDRELVIVVTPRIIKRSDYGEILGRSL